MVKKATARIQDGAVQTVQVNLLDQLTLVPERFVLGGFCIFLLGL